MLILPVVAMAAPETVEGVIRRLTNTILTVVIPFLLVVATLIFIYAIIGYIRAAGESTEQEKMRALILWSVIALAAILSLWALVGFITSYVGTAGIPGATAPNPFQSH